MSIIGSNILAGAAGSGVSAYEIEQSLRFDGSSYLDRTFSTLSSAPSSGTLSFWIKPAKPNGTATEYIFNVRPSDGYQTILEITTDRKLQEATNFGGYQTRTNPGQLRDPSAWMHVVYQYQSSGTGNSVKFFINGVQMFSGAADSRANYFWGDNAGTWPARIGNSAGGTSQPFYGYLAEFHSCNGNHYAPTEFGEYDENGVWRPIKTSGLSYGTNGFYLKFDPSATNGIGHDHSGNGNNFTASGFTTSGTGTDVMSDTPTTNWATFNALYESINGTLANGNLEINASSNTIFCLGNFIIPASSTNKYYWEVKYEGGPNFGIGIKKPAPGGTQFGDSMRLDENDGQNSQMAGVGVFSGFTSVTTPSTTTAEGDVIGVAYDPSAGTIKWTKNGSAYAEASGLPSVDVVPLCGRVSSSGSQTSKFIINFGQRDFEYDPPTGGYVALNTSNLPAPTVKDGSDYFNTVLYTGNGSTQSITGVGFQPDWVWAKQRNSSRYHSLYDSVRGADLLLQSQATSAEIDANGTGVTSFDSDGFTVGSDNGVNQSSGTYVAWNWLASNTSGSSNTDGSITSTVSVNPSAGFSIVSYTGNGTAGATVGHGLGVAPAFIITKNRDNGSAYWGTYHHSLGTSKKLYLNDIQAPDTASNWIGVSSTVITWNQTGANNVNENGSDFICYCFAEVEGYSKFGSYVGNLNFDGPFIYTGFRPAFVMWKRNGVDGWVMKDTTRSPYNTMSQVLYANLQNAESSTQEVDFLSNGFKIRTNSGASNAIGDTYVYMALAENPFGGSGVSPATAR